MEPKADAVRGWEWLGVALATGAFVALRSPLFTTPGLLLGWNSDAALFGLMARAIRDGIDVPVFFWGQFYLGTLTSLLTAALSVALQAPIGPLLLRIGASLEVWTAALLFWLGLRRTFGREAALLATFWLAAGPAFLFHFTIAPIGAEQLFLIAALVFWYSTRASFERRGEWFVLGMLCGFGMWLHQGVMFLAAAVGVALLAGRKLTGPRVALALLGAAVGSLPAAVSLLREDLLLYSTTTDKPIGQAEKTTLPSAPIAAGERSVFTPTSEFFIDEEKIETTRGFKLFIEDVNVGAGVTSDQLFVSRSTIFMSDMLGNRRFIASLDSVSTFSNFDFLYLDMHRRMNWGLRLFDDRSFFYAPNADFTELERRQFYRQTGALGLVSYPFTRYHRLDAGAGMISRDYFYPRFFDDPEAPGGSPEFVAYEHRKDTYPIVSSTFSGDSAVWKFFGPVSGRRYQVSASYAPDPDEGGALSADLNIDWREYFQLSSRTLLAARVYGAFSEGNAPNFYYFGGLNTLRGYDFRTLLGQHAAFANFEFRFPLIDVLATPVIVLQQIRGTLFFDIGAARFEDQEFDFMDDDGRLKDGKAAVGWGLSFRFWDMQLNWDFAKRFDLKDTEGGFRTSFWIGETF